MNIWLFVIPLVVWHLLLADYRQPAESLTINECASIDRIDDVMRFVTGKSILTIIAMCSIFHTFGIFIKIFRYTA